MNKFEFKNLVKDLKDSLKEKSFFKDLRKEVSQIKGEDEKNELLRQALINEIKAKNILNNRKGKIKQAIVIDQIEVDEKELKDKIIKFRQDELNHKDIAYEEGATKKGLYSIMDKVIKTGSKIAIKISEKI